MLPSSLLQTSWVQVFLPRKQEGKKEAFLLLPCCQIRALLSWERLFCRYRRPHFSLLWHWEIGFLCSTMPISFPAFLSEEAEKCPASLVSPLIVSTYFIPQCSPGLFSTNFKRGKPKPYSKGQDGMVSNTEQSVPLGIKGKNLLWIPRSCETVDHHQTWTTPLQPHF